MFLIVALLIMFVVFTETGQTWLRRYLGIDIAPTGKSEIKKQEKQKEKGYTENFKYDARLENGSVA
jgi:hypothetical protein